MKVTNYIIHLLLILPATVTAQNIMTSSPYSMFGLGEITTGLYGQNAAMGGVSQGMRGSWLINSENPAGLVGLDSCMLVAEASGFGKFESYQSKGSKNNAFTGNVSAFSLGGRIMPRWYMAAGLTPFSSVGYYFKNSQPLEGSPGSTINSTYEGNGGLSRIHLTNAFLITPRLSAGVNLSYIFGNITLDETQSTMAITEKTYAQTFYADFGLQYHQPFTRDLSLTLGATYGYRQKVTMDNSVVITNGDNQGEKNRKNTRQYLPQFMGGGAAINYKKMTYALDYSFHQYSSISSADSRIKFRDSHEVRAGVRYAPNGYSSQSFWKRSSYKAGINVSTPYLSINDNSGISWRATLGMGLPVMNGIINAAFFYDRTQLKNNTLQKDVVGLTVTYTIGELFHKVKL